MGNGKRGFGDLGIKISGAVNSVQLLDATTQKIDI
jgi:hypothetical protein